jgi:hypothetical protein
VAGTEEAVVRYEATVPVTVKVGPVSVGTSSWWADSNAVAEYVVASLGGTPRLSRWQRTLVYFGLARDPRVPYTHSFAPSFWPAMLGPSATFTELWGDWGWED